MKLKFTVSGEARTLRTHQIMELCDYLTARVLEPMFARQGAKWDAQFMNFFTFDNACDPLEPTGTIRFKVPPLFAGQVGELESAIRQELSALGIKTGPFTHERSSGPPSTLLIAIPITENPTAVIEPPEVNMSRTRACVVLRDLLGYETSNGRYEFTADDLLQRVASVTDDKIAACTASPVKCGEKVQPTPSPASMQAVRRCLQEIQRFAQWALQHNCRHLAAA